MQEELEQKQPSKVVRFISTIFVIVLLGAGAFFLVRDATTYTMPPVGSNNTLGLSEIRWCEREDIRTDAMLAIVKGSVQTQYLNGLIDDYNKRCGSYQYRNFDHQIAKFLVGFSKDSITAEAEAELRAVNSGNRNGNANAQ